MLFPPVLSDFIEENHPVRVINDVIEVVMLLVESGHINLKTVYTDGTKIE